MLPTIARHTFAKFFILLLCFSSLSLADTDKAATPPEFPLLKPHFGYLLIELEVGGIAPAMEYKRHGKSNSTATLKLKDIDKRFLLLTLKKGRYQVTQIHAPLYNLPYRLETIGNSFWRFDIAPGKINYFGKLLIKAERETDSVTVNRFNRLAKTIDDIKVEYAELLNEYPIVSAAGYRDDFYQEFISSEGVH